MSDCILKRARCLEMKGTLSAGRPHRPPWSPQSCWLRLAFSLKAAPINCEGDPYEESYISPSQMWPHSVTSLKTRSVLGIFWLSHTLWHVISLKNRTHKTRPRDKSAQNSFSERKTILTRGGHFFSACTSAIPQTRGRDELKLDLPHALATAQHSLARKSWLLRLWVQEIDSG